MMRAWMAYRCARKPSETVQTYPNGADPDTTGVHYHVDAAGSHQCLADIHAALS